MDVFAANDIAAFVNITGSENTTAGRFDSSYTNKSIRAPFTCPGFIDPSDGSAVTLADGWLHFDLFNGTTGSSGSAVLTLKTVGLVDLFRLIATSSSQLRCDYWNGSAWVTTFTTAFSLGNQSVLNTLDLHWNITATTIEMDIYRNSSVVAQSGVVSFSGMADVGSFTTANGSYSSGAYFSQFLVANSNTVDSLVKSLVLTGAGANTDWAGVYTDIEEISINDATLLSTSTLGDKESFTADDATLPTNYYVGGVWQAVRARESASSPTTVTPMLRIGGVDYSLSYNFPMLNNSSFEGSVACFEVDPSTAAAWSGVTNVNAAEIGYEATA